MKAFNLDEAISQWRKDLDKHPGLEPGYIEELEAHLLDKIEVLTYDGLSVKDAFDKATKEQFENINEVAEQFHVARTRYSTKPSWKSNSWLPTLLPNYIKVSFRSIFRNKGYSFIKVFGLAIGFATALLVTLFVLDEFSFDQHHEKADRTYRVVREYEWGGNQEATVNGSPAGLAKALETQLPEVEKAINVISLSSGNPYITFNQNTLRIKTHLFATPDLFDVFDYPMIFGNPESALSRPNTIILTKEVAEALFGNKNPIGNTISITASRKIDYEVTGVLESLPSQSHLQFDVITPNSFGANSNGVNWYFTRGITYVLLNEESALTDIESKLDDFVERANGTGNKLYLENLLDIHLYSKIGELSTISGDIRFVYTFSITAFLILFIASINFTNLSIAQTQKRSKEVGIRKVLGANRAQLVKQLLGESQVFAFLALPFSMLLFWMALPFFNQLVGKSLSLTNGNYSIIWLSMLGITILTGLFAGSYGTAFLSSFSPYRALRGTVKTSILHLFVNKGLLVTQFTIAIALIAVTLIINRQLDYATSVALGFDQEHLVVVPASSFDETQISLFKQEALKNSTVVGATASGWIPGDSKTGVSGSLDENETPSGEAVSIIIADINPNFFSVMGIPVKFGRYFSNEDFVSEKEPGFFGSQYTVVNETFINRVGLNPDNVIGKKANVPGMGSPEIVGILEDFHITSFHHEIEPIAFRIGDGPSANNLLIRINSEQYQTGLAHLENVWKSIDANTPFEFFFLDDYIQQLYTVEQKMSSLINVLAAMAIFIATLGLFGLVAFMAEQRTKEIGIRKILGASVTDLIVLLAKNYTLLISISFLLATPIALSIGNFWLQDFAYKITPGLMVFLTSGLGTLALALIIITYRAYNAARKNPVNSLRSE